MSAKQAAKSEKTRIRKSTQERLEAAPSHVLIRVRSENGQTINEHANVISAHGAALFGKIGQPIGATFREELNTQTAAGIKSFLFITIRDGWNGPYITYRCLLRNVAEKLTPEKRRLVPTYYLSEASAIKTWFEVSSIVRLSRDEMNRITVISSGRQIMSVIKSSATVFRVQVGSVSAEPPKPVDA